ncbi:Leukotriene a-4 hydrolase/aminopeptidase [Globisporangium polare]
MRSFTTSPRALAHHSFANLDEVTFTHLHWSVDIDFERQQLRGSAEYAFTFAPATSASRASPVLVLDTHHLTIEKTFVDGEQVSFHLQKVDKVFGSALVIPITLSATNVRVQYATTEASSGLQWLPKELTAGKTNPYLFTQCQAIHARSIVPTPDTPACKFTYSAFVTVPEWCTVLLSAIADDGEKRVDGKRFVSFQQQVPIPSYLLAIAAGHLESADLSPRCRVWAEPSVVGKAAYEFAQTEDFLKHAEDITGQEYVWKRYDLVCLPPSFPYGGMENPCLTFVTPTLLAGDRSLADVVAHEISHSWTGNLVTNRTWSDFWLNEGWTRWLECKILARIHDDPLAYDLKASIGLRALGESVKNFGAEHPYTHLVPDSDGVDPDDVFSSVPYEKGFNFLHYLTTVVGGHNTFEVFARAYIREFRFKTVTSTEFQAFFTQYFTNIVDKKEAIQQVDWHMWYHTPGMPPIPANFDTTRAAPAIALGEQIVAGADPTTWTSVSHQAIKKWSATLWILMLDSLLTSQSSGTGFVFTQDHLDAIDAFCHKHLSTTHNAELRFRWYTLSLRAQDTRLLAKICGFLQEQGRMKYVRPLFRDLCKTIGAAQTVEIFNESKSLYHPIAAKMIQRDIAAAVEQEEAVKSGKISTTTTTSKTTVVKKTSVAKMATAGSWFGLSDAAAGYLVVAVTVSVTALVGLLVAPKRR